MRRPNLHGRLVGIFVIFALMLTGLVGRLGQVQLSDPDIADAAAQQGATHTVRTPAPRGRILDRRGRAIVDNAVRVDVSVDRGALVDQEDGGGAVLGRLAEVLDTSRSALEDRMTLCGAPDAAARPRCWAGSAYVPVTVAEGVDPEVALAIADRSDRYEGVTVTTTAVRRDRDHPLAPQVLGYLTRPDADTIARSHGTISDDDLVGAAGLEQQYDEVLRGRPGESTVEVDPRGIVTRTLSTTPPQPGEDITTALDIDVQRATQRALADATRTARAKGHRADNAAAVVVDLEDGGVVASASLPTYDPSVWTGGISQADYDELTKHPSSSPLTDRVAGATFPPASTFKVVSLPAAVKAGTDLERPVDCASSVRIGNRTFTNFESRAYGRISWHRALVVSCDTVFYREAESIWRAAGGLSGRDDAADPIVQTSEAMGLGRPTGIDLPDEASGRIPGRTWKREYWEATKEDTCRRARDGYPQMRDRARARYLQALAKESCRTGYQLRPGDEVNLSIGQGDMLVTPLQMAQVYAAIARQGEVRTPRLVTGTRSPDGATTRLPVAPAREVPLDAEVGAYIRPALSEVVTKGTAAGAFRGFDLRRWPVAGKTGTAEVYGKQDTAWFVSYAPADKPRYAVAVVIAQGGTGGGAAAQASRAIHAELADL